MNKSVKNPWLLVSVVFLLFGFSVSSSEKEVQNFPKVLRGQIVSSQQEVTLPSSAENFAKKVREQDQNTFNKGSDGFWTIHFVAFFNRSLPSDTMGVVVLDAQKEPVAVADVAGKHGQTSLASQIVVEGTETPGKPHLLKVYFAKGGKPVMLAQKQIVLK